ncbi:MAG: cupin domain-containing protein [Rhodobacteraceae bacterium]|nr:cupin domain-containing protein [Paracoccaceae bacterium]
MQTFLLLAEAAAAVAPEHGSPPPDRVIAGDPRFTTWNLEDRDGLFCGIWEATPGKWRIAYDEWEYCRILAGRSVVTAQDGAAIALGPGDSLVLRPGFRGTWEVIETTRKDYVILMPRG